MSFTISFMYNNEPMNKITKSPISRFSASGTLRDECSIVDPEFIVEHDDPTSANYAYIEAMHRYYYITDITAYRSYTQGNVTHNLWKIKMHCDVLKTFSEGILGSPCIITKTASGDFNLFLPDPNFKCQQNSLIGLQNFPSGFSDITPKFYMTFFG